MQYFIGDFDGTAFTSTSKTAWADWGRDFYAAITFDNAPDDRRILLGWMSNWDYAGEVPTEPWRGGMSLPRQLGLISVGGVPRLRQRPVPEVAALDFPNAAFTADSFRLVNDERAFQGGSPVRIDVAFRAVDGAEFGIDVLKGPGEATSIVYSTESGQLTLDRTASGRTDFNALFPSAESVPVALAEGVLRLRVIVDSASVEIFAQDGTANLDPNVTKK